MLGDKSLAGRKLLENLNIENIVPAINNVTTQECMMPSFEIF